MFDGPVAPNELLPQNAAKIIKMAEWWWHSSRGMESWATQAKECVDFLESRQYTEAEMAILKGKGRAHFIFNKISPLFRLMVGYHGNNETDWKFQPGDDGIGTETVADVITQVAKQIAHNVDLTDLDSEMFQDGITTGRGWQDTRMSWEENDFGEIAVESADPFTVFPDPQLAHYDCNRGKFIQRSKFISLEEVEWLYGKPAANHLRGHIHGASSLENFPSMFQESGGVIQPQATFAELELEESLDQWRDILGNQFIDRSRKTIRMVDTQYYVRKVEPVMVDLETGTRAQIPPGWGRKEIEKALSHAEQMGQPITIANRLIRRVHWTVIVGDVIVHDEPSPYESFTLQGFFPYFRRGQTMGMIHDLRDPQREINKRRNAEIEAVTRNSGGGWKFHQKSMSPRQKANLKKYGSSAGFNLEWGGGAITDDLTLEPKRIEPAAPAHAAERLEDRARNDLRDISGFNEAALGELDKVQSGRALEARQRQAVLAVQMYLSNYTRTKKLVGRKWLELIQRHMRQERIFRIIGEGGQLSQLLINEQQRDPETGQIIRLNDVTLGKYSLVVDETPLSATFKNAQFEEAMAMLERIGPLMGPEAASSLADILVDMSSIPQPQKDMIKERLAQVTGLPPAEVGGGVVNGGALTDVSTVPGTVQGGQALLPAPVR